MIKFFRAHVRMLLITSLALYTLGRAVFYPFALVDDPSASCLILDRILFGQHPAGSHAINVLLHLINVWLIYLLMLRLGVPRPRASWAAGLFALHPIVVEPVCLLMGRKDLLATIFTLIALLVAAGRDSAHARPSRRRWAAVLCLCALAMVSKWSALTTPLLVYLLVRHCCPDLSRRRLALMLAPLALAVGFLFLSGARLARASGQRVFDALESWTLHASHVLYPRGLVAEYYSQRGDPSDLLIAVVMIATLALAIYGAVRTRRGSLERMSLLFVALAYAPASGLLKTEHWTADSYMYLPMVAVTLVVATVLVRLWPGLDGFALVLPALAVLSSQQSETWASHRNYFEAVVARYPNQPRALNRLAFAVSGQDPKAAAAIFIELDQAHRDFPFDRGQRVSAYASTGDFGSAEALLAECVRRADQTCAATFFDDLVRDRFKPDLFTPEMLGAVQELAKIGHQYPPPQEDGIGTK